MCRQSRVLIVRVDAAIGSEPDVEALALPSRDTFLLTLVGLPDAGFLWLLFGAIRRSADSPDDRQATKRNYGRYDMPGHGSALAFLLVQNNLDPIFCHFNARLLQYHGTSLPLQPTVSPASVHSA
jgi:hypothetical protein